MGRWEPDARGRLGQAAMDLYAERGFDQTTVADIAERAGLTARTFFRHFADKREVLFSGSDTMGAQLVDAVVSAPGGVGPLDAVAVALDVVADYIGDDREHSARRRALIVANDELQERELMKLAAWSRSLADGLRRRGVASPMAELVAETGMAVFRVGFDAWLNGPATRSLAGAIHDSFAELRTATSAG